MITRFAKGMSTDNYKKTIGTDFMEKEITVPNTGDTVKLMLWDTAGQEMFSKLTRNYYKGTNPTRSKGARTWGCGVIT